MNKFTTERDACRLEVSRLNLVGCCNAIRESRIAARPHPEKGCWAVAVGGQSSGCPPRSGLFIHDFDLLIDHFAGETVDRHACLAVGRRGDRKRVYPPSNAAPLIEIPPKQHAGREASH